MATLGTAAKMRRVLEFLLGLRDDRVGAALATCGFSASDRERGWTLLRNLGMTQAAPPPAALDHAPDAALDGWRYQWLRIAKVSLELDFPRVHDQIFAGIGWNQPSIAVLSKFLARYEKLQRAADGPSRAAVAKLAARGLTSERIQEARELMMGFAVLKPVQVIDPAIRRAAVTAAEAALWNYYLEWSQIARAVIKKPRLLSLLGFGAPTDDAEPEQPPTAAGAPAAPAAEAASKPVTTGKPRPRRKAKPRGAAVRRDRSRA